MKKMIFTIAMMIFGCAYCSQLQAAKLVIQTRAHGKDCDKDRGFCFSIEIDIAGLGAISNPAWQADATSDGRTLTLKTESIKTPWGGDDFIVDQDIKIPANVARALGFNSITIKEGTYKIDFSSNKLGTIKLNISSN